MLTGVPWGTAPLARLLPSLPTHHSLLGLDEGPAEAVHFGVEPAGVAQVVAGAVPPPQRGLDGAAVDALPALGQVLQQLWGQEQRGEAVGYGRRRPQSPGSPAQSGPGPAEPEPGSRRASTRPPEKQFPGSDGGRAVIFYKIPGFFLFLFILMCQTRCRRSGCSPSRSRAGASRTPARRTAHPRPAVHSRRDLTLGKFGWGPLEGRNPRRGAHRAEREVHLPLEGSRGGSEVAVRIATSRAIVGAGYKDLSFCPIFPRVEAWQELFYPDSYFKCLATSKASSLEAAIGALVCQGSDGQRQLRLSYLVKLELVRRKQRKWENMRYCAFCFHSY